MTAILDTRHTALVIVDLQNDFVRQGAPMAVEDARASLPRVKQLIAAARRRKLPIIYTKFVTGPCRTFLWNWSPQLEKFGVCRRGLARHYADIGTERLCNDIVDEIYPLPEDYIVEKYGYSSFNNTNLQDILLSEGRDTIIVAGTVTHICVADTVHDAFALGIKAVVASDGVSSLTPDLQAAFLKNFALKFGWVKTSAQIIRLLAGDKPNRRVS